MCPVLTLEPYIIFSLHEDARISCAQHVMMCSVSFIHALTHPLSHSGQLVNPFNLETNDLLEIILIVFPQ